MAANIKTRKHREVNAEKLLAKAAKENSEEISCKEQVLALADFLNKDFGYNGKSLDAIAAAIRILQHREATTNETLLPLSACPEESGVLGHGQFIGLKVSGRVDLHRKAIIVDEVEMWR